MTFGNTYSTVTRISELLQFNQSSLVTLLEGIGILSPRISKLVVSADGCTEEGHIHISYFSLSCFLFSLEMLLLSHPHSRGCACWLAGSLSCSPKVLHAVIALA